jgi:hypothetical protein
MICVFIELPYKLNLMVRLIVIACIIGILLPCNLFAQNDSIRINSTWEMGRAWKMESGGQSESKGVFPFKINDHPRPLRPSSESDSARGAQKGSADTGNYRSEQVTAPIVTIGRNFEGNHLFGGTPADAAIGISNDGLIVSIDNETVSYFKENGDTVVKYGLPIRKWYDDPTFDRSPFDPRVIYDRNANRFIATMVYHSMDYSDSRILISFSEPLVNDSISWTHYQVICDSVYFLQDEEWYWFDFPVLAINDDELFISATAFKRDTANNINDYGDLLLLQIRKAEGYAGANSLVIKKWKNVQNTDGNFDGTLVPLSDGFQSPGYGPGCYMVSNYSTNSTKFFWYELTGGINDPNSQIIAHLTATSFFYSKLSYASQMGGLGTDRIVGTDCEIRAGFHQNGKLHFVMSRSDNGWGELVYARITPSTNFFEVDTWGGAEESLNSIHPSIAPFGRDSSEENSMIAFLRTGPTIFPELCVINFDSSWSPDATVVKAGVGLINLVPEFAAPWGPDSLERFGDYTDIQRRYNDPQNACWLVGSFAAGPVPNHFGVANGIKAWIAEVGDSTVVAVPEAYNPTSFNIFPNPIRPSETSLYIQTPKVITDGRIRIFNTQGSEVLNTNFQGQSFSIQIPDFPAGIYFLQITSNKDRYATRKLLILP